MNRDKAHKRIGELLELMEVNNNRLFLQDDTISKAETAYLRSLINKLFEQVDVLELSGNKGDIQYKMPEERIVHEEQVKLEIVPEKKVLPADLEEKKLPIETIKIVEEVVEKTTISPVIEDTVEIVEKPPKMTPAQEPEIEESQPIVEVPTVEPVALAENANKPVAKEIPELERDGGLYDKIRHSKIDSIKKAISISKRYEFQSELFGKDPETYNVCMKALDSCDSMKSAYALLGDYSKNYSWNEESELVEELKTVLLRRYM